MKLWAEAGRLVLFLCPSLKRDGKGYFYSDLALSGKGYFYNISIILMIFELLI